MILYIVIWNHQILLQNARIIQQLKWLPDICCFLAFTGAALALNKGKWKQSNISWLILIEWVVLIFLKLVGSKFGNSDRFNVKKKLRFPWGKKCVFFFIIRVLDTRNLNSYFLRFVLKTLVHGLIFPSILVYFYVGRKSTSQRHS